MRKLKRGELTLKDMSVLRETPNTKTQHDSNSASFKDYSLRHNVAMQWDLNEEAKRDKMFKLIIDDKTVILDSEEVMRALRWV